MSAVAEAAPPAASSRVAETAAQRILIVRLGSMGDILHSLPAVAALRRALPQAHLGWVVEERWAELLCSRPELRGGPRSAAKPLVDVLHTVDTHAWRRRPFARPTLAQLAAVRAAMHAEHYQLVIDLQSAVKSAVVARAAGAPVRLGFARPREAPAALLYTRRIPARGKHIAEQNLSLAEAALRLAGAEVGEAALQFPLPRDEQHEDWAEAQRRRAGAFVLINPGAGWGAKCWPAERFGEVARALQRHGLTAIVNHGPGEADLANDVVQAAGGVAEALACGVGELIALTRRARLCVGGDTGPTHLAGALGVPLVAIYGPTNPARNGPLGSRAIVLRHESSVTSHARRPKPEAGLLNVSAEEAIAAARTLLAEPVR